MNYCLNKRSFENEQQIDMMWMRSGR
jgi:hypothetical protein